jgi:hypothetical protein
MRHYKLKTLEETKAGFSDLWILPFTELVPGATTAQVLTALQPGDVVYRVLLENKTLVAGVTATVSIGVVGTLTQFTAAVDQTAAGSKYTAAIAAATPYATNTSAINMVANEIVGAGTPTAGEVWVWACISRVEERGANAGQTDA